MIKYNIVTTLSAYPPKDLPDMLDPKSDEAFSTNFPVYFGIIGDVELTEELIGSLPSILLYNRVFEWNNISGENTKICYAYPAIFGQLETIEDENGNDIYDEFEGYEIELNNSDYFVYVSATLQSYDAAKILFR